MKQALLLILLFISSYAFCQTPVSPTNVEIKLENNSLEIYKLALLSFKPGENNNGTMISKMLPYSVKKYSFPVGTALYFARPEQIEYTMSGQSVKKRGDKPDLILKATDAGKTIKLNK